jgi:hypothetical protein
LRIPRRCTNSEELCGEDENPAVHEERLPTATGSAVTMPPTLKRRCIRFVCARVTKISGFLPRVAANRGTKNELRGVDCDSPTHTMRVCEKEERGWGWVRVRGWKKNVMRAMLLWVRPTHLRVHIQTNK